jgi:HSP20 family molecular chaperone IbpA
MKKSDRHYDKRKQKKSFDMFDADEEENFSIQIRRLYESLCRIQQIERRYWHEFPAYNWLEYNFIINDQSRDEPIRRKFDLDPLTIVQKNAKNFDEADSSYDIVKDDDTVSITIAIPALKKEEIKLRITNDTVEVFSVNPKENHSRFFTLPCNVYPEAATFTFNNGILDIIIPRKKRGIG